MGVTAIAVTDALPRADQGVERDPGAKAAGDIQSETNERAVGSRREEEPPGEAKHSSSGRGKPAGRRVRWRVSVAVGRPEDGRLLRGVKLPAEDPTYFTWDPIRKRQPNRDWRRWGTDDLVRTTLRILREFRRDHPNAPRVGIGDLSLPKGGYFGPEVSGGIGHATHRNGLDIDVYYPRRDRRERAPTRVGQVDLRLSQDLVDRFVAARAVRVFVGPNTPLTGPADVVQAIPNHDNHLHARVAG